MTKKIALTQVEGRSSGWYGLLVLFGTVILAGLGSPWYMEHNGHWVTGMNNQIVWGMPHVFAVFLIVAASGALNVASISSVFGRNVYKPLAPLSALLSISLLAGGLAVLVLDLGRPDRLIVAMTHYNFKSIFAWNIYLYTGFFVIVGVYMWMMLEKKMNRHTKTAGLVAFLWRLALTTGTGSIFGFLVARQAYDAAIMAPMFIIMSFAYGLAIFILVIKFSYTWLGRPIGAYVCLRQRNLLRVFLAAMLYFVAVYHLTNLYATEHHGVERFILLEGGIFTALFWIGQIMIGGIIPLVLMFHPATSESRIALRIAAFMVIIGGICQMYVTIIGGQAYPLVLFPGMEVSSSFFDGQINSYTPTLAEIVLGVSGIAIALVLVLIVVKFLKILPASLADSAFDPNYVEPVIHPTDDEAPETA
ncbi:MAG: polysulfide reductase NrfD [Rhodospirillales bacterium]|nr:polysulfide reductase NrfD [Rhodospirillales bacterium]